MSNLSSAISQESHAEGFRLLYLSSGNLIAEDPAYYPKIYSALCMNFFSRGVPSKASFPIIALLRFIPLISSNAVHPRKVLAKSLLHFGDK